MTNSRYVKGRRAEYQVRDLLESTGALVIRSAGSHSAADLVALWPWGTCAFQIKTGKVSEADREKTMAAADKTAAPWILLYRGEGWRGWGYGAVSKRLTRELYGLGIVLY